MSRKFKGKAFSAAIPLRHIKRFLKLTKAIKGCWVWTGYKDTKGYGQFKWRGKARWAHRLSYVIFRGAIPSGVTIHHKCRNPSCVNPNHLELMSHEANSTRKDEEIPF